MMNKMLDVASLEFTADVSGAVSETISVTVIVIKTFTSIIKMVDDLAN